MIISVDPGVFFGGTTRKQQQSYGSSANYKQIICGFKIQKCKLNVTDNNDIKP